MKDLKQIIYASFKIKYSSIKVNANILDDLIQL